MKNSEEFAPSLGVRTFRLQFAEKHGQKTLFPINQPINQEAEVIAEPPEAPASRTPCRDATPYVSNDTSRKLPLPSKPEGFAISSNDTSSELQRLCRAVMEKLSPEFAGKTIDARFYPYMGLTHTIRRRESGGWTVRISDHCRCAPHPVIEAIVTILTCKALRKRIPKHARQIYDDWRREPAISDAVNARRVVKGRKCFAAHEGRWHPLPEICRDINRRFFNDQIEIQKIGWGIRRSWGRLGHYDPAHHTITLSPVLDSQKVPRYVVDFIVYHEMLHAVFEGAGNYGYHRHHPPAFRRTERAHPDYDAVKKFIKTFCSKRK